MATTYIVVPKVPMQEQLSLAAVQPEQARARVHDVAEADEFATDAARILEGRGLRRQQQEAADLRENRYTPLPHMGVIIASFDSEELANAVASDMEEYRFVPDIELSLPEPGLAGAETVEINPKELGLLRGESGINEAHSQGVRGQGVLVGVLDTGCDADHDEHSAAIRTFRYIPLSVHCSRDVRGFDPSGHGTHVCGILAGRQLGIAPDINLWVTSVIESETTRTSLRRVIAGLDWLTRIFSLPTNRGQPALINMSLGFLDSWLSSAELNLVHITIRQMFQQLETLGILSIVAIGNDGAGTVRGPGYLPEVLAVGAIDGNREPAIFSGSGPSPINSSVVKPDIVGYGVDIPSSYERDCLGTSLYRLQSGTSMATPYVTGIAALHASANRTLIGNSLKNQVISTALALPQHPRDRVGAGLARFL
jgi:subtilisin family serine protease